MIDKKNKQRVMCIVTLYCFVLIACKSKQLDLPKTTDADTSASSIKKEGIVTHQYKSVGCETIIICKPTNENDTLFLIPMTSLEKFDIDNLKISFNYRILRVHNPKGCKQGIPAQISNIKIKQR